MTVRLIKNQEERREGVWQRGIGKRESGGAVWPEVGGLRL